MMDLVVQNADLWAWAPPEPPFLRAVTTNGVVKARGELVMGRGTALQATQRYPDLPRRLGALVTQGGNRVHVLSDLGICAFPTKHDWRQPSDLFLIQRSAAQLREILVAKDCLWKAVILPKPGCGNGDLSWAQVEPVLRQALFDQPVYIVGR